MPRLDRQYSFQKRVVQGNDGLGNELSDWVEQFVTRAARKWLRGSEEVLASRLSGVHVAILTIRMNQASELANSFWRCVDSRTGETYNIMTSEPHENRQYIDFLVQSGVADG